MKKRYVLVLLLTSIRLCSYAQEALTFEKADSLLARNAQSAIDQKNVEEARASLQQSKNYANPTVQWMHNIKNPTNHRWLDTGKTGEDDIQLSQPIAIGGQHKDVVRQNEALLKGAKADQRLSLTERRRDLHETMIDAYTIRQKEEIIQKEIASAEEILKAYEQQTAKGNIPAMETLRIKTMLYGLKQEQTSLLLQEQALWKDIRTQTGTSLQTCCITSGTLDADLLQLSQRLESQELSHPSVSSVVAARDASQWAWKTEKANALPQISLQGEYDKNGNIGHNYFAFGASVSVPLWNHNKGNIAAARARYEQSVLAVNQLQTKMRRQWENDYQTAVTWRDAVAAQSRNFSSELEKGIEATETQMKHHNISVLEFVDYYSNYKDMKYQLLDAQAELLKAHEAIKYDLAE
jgi:cobalt-zinc-cadmium efflux system outer membrane protein